MRITLCRLAIAVRDSFNSNAAGVLWPEDQGAALKKLTLEDARSRCEEQPIDFSCVGTPAEFRAQCAQRHVEVQVEFPIINIIGYPLPSDKP